MLNSKLLIYIDLYDFQALSAAQVIKNRTDSGMFPGTYPQRPGKLVAQPTNPPRGSTAGADRAGPPYTIFPKTRYGGSTNDDTF